MELKGEINSAAQQIKLKQ